MKILRWLSVVIQYAVQAAVFFALLILIDILVPLITPALFPKHTELVKHVFTFGTYLIALRVSGWVIGSK